MMQLSSYKSHADDAAFFALASAILGDYGAHLLTPESAAAATCSLHTQLNAHKQPACNGSTGWSGSQVLQYKHAGAEMQQCSWSAEPADQFRARRSERELVLGGVRMLALRCSAADGQQSPGMWGFQQAAVGSCSAAGQAGAQSPQVGGARGGCMRVLRYSNVAALGSPADGGCSKPLSGLLHLQAPG